MKKYVSILLLLCLLLSACGNSADPTESLETAPAATTAPVPATTEPTTEPEPQYELQTVYLCTLETMTQYDTGAVFKTAHAYDENGLRTESWRVESDGSKGYTTVYTYDEAGNLLHENDIHRTYDEAGNMLSQCYGDEGDYLYEFHFTYDDAGFPIEEVRIRRYTTEEIITYTITYDAAHTSSEVLEIENEEVTAITKETYNTSGDVLTSYTYDPDGNFLSGLTCEYDTDGKILKESKYSGSETQADYSVIYTYDENGLLISKNADYYYGNLVEYTYEPFEIWVLIQE